MLGRGGEANGEWSLMQYLLFVFFENCETLDRGQAAGATDRQLTEYMNLTALFAQIIKQNYLLYLEINNSEAITLQ